MEFRVGPIAELSRWQINDFAPKEVVFLYSVCIRENTHEMLRCLLRDVFIYYNDKLRIFHFRISYLLHQFL